MNSQHTCRDATFSDWNSANCWAECSIFIDTLFRLSSTNVATCHTSSMSQIHRSTWLFNVLNKTAGGYGWTTVKCRKKLCTVWWLLQIKDAVRQDWRKSVQEEKGKVMCWERRLAVICGPMCIEVAFLQSSTKSTQVEPFAPEWLVINNNKIPFPTRSTQKLGQCRQPDQPLSLQPVPATEFWDETLQPLTVKTYTYSNTSIS